MKIELRWVCGNRYRAFLVNSVGQELGCLGDWFLCEAMPTKESILTSLGSLVDQIVKAYEETRN